MDATKLVARAALFERTQLSAELFGNAATAHDVSPRASQRDGPPGSPLPAPVRADPAPVSTALVQTPRDGHCSNCLTALQFGPLPGAVSPADSAVHMPASRGARRVRVYGSTGSAES